MIISDKLHGDHTALLSWEGCHREQRGGVVERLRVQKRKLLICTVLYSPDGWYETNTIGYYTDYWGAYTRHLEPDVHCPGKRNTQKIERKHLTLWTRIKRLVRKTICFSKTTQMHDIVIGLFVNRYAFGRAV